MKFTSEQIRELWELASSWLAVTSETAGAASDIIEDALQANEQEPEPIPEPEPEPEPPTDTRSYQEKTYTKDVETVTIYVDPDGSDSNSGLSPDSPVQTVAKGISILRNGKPDWLLFKRGGVWNGQTFGNWELSGKSSEAPMLIGSYGHKTLPRPRFNTGTSGGLNSFPRGNPPREPLNADYLVFVGLHFVASNRDPNSPTFNSNTNPTGFRFLRGTKGLRIDDCRFELYHANIVIQSYLGTKPTNVEVINSQLFDAYAHSPSSGHSQGAYMDGIDGLKIENCIFDRNGHIDTVSSSEPTIYNHNLYIQTTCKNVRVTNNIFARASSHGCQLRPGGNLWGNFFYRNPIALMVGYVGIDYTGEPFADVYKNVIVEGTKISHALPRSWGIEFKTTNPPGVTIRENVVANMLDVSPNSRSIEVKSNVVYDKNVVHNWPPTNELVNPNANYVNPDISIEDVALDNTTFSGPNGFYSRLRDVFADGPQIKTDMITSQYFEAFSEVTNV